MTGSNPLDNPYIKCPICKDILENNNDIILTHTTAKHDGLDRFQDTSFVGNDDVAAFIAENFERTTELTPTRAIPAVPRHLPDEADDGIMMAEAITARPRIITGAGESSPEAIQLLWVAANSLAENDDFNVNKAQLFTSLSYAFLLHDATEENATHGSITLVHDGNEDLPDVLVTFNGLYEAWARLCREKNYSRPTWRQLANKWGPRIWTMIQKNSHFQKLSKSGTPLSRQFTIQPQYFYAVTSFFAAMKPPHTWTSEEFAAFDVHRRAVLPKLPSTKTDNSPSNLRMSGGIRLPSVPLPAETRTVEEQISEWPEWQQKLFRGPNFKSGGLL